jgi:hypothetical protein
MPQEMISRTYTARMNWKVRSGFAGFVKMATLCSVRYSRTGTLNDSSTLEKRLAESFKQVANVYDTAVSMRSGKRTVASCAWHPCLNPCQGCG